MFCQLQQHAMQQFWKINSLLRMGLILLELSEMMGMTDWSDFAVFFCLNFFFLQYFFYFLLIKLKILGLHSFLIHTAQIVSELHILCRTAR